MFLRPITLEGYEGCDSEPIERTFVTGQIIPAKVLRETNHAVDFSIYGTEYYNVDKKVVSVRP
jgi:hypothetical protein